MKLIRLNFTNHVVFALVLSAFVVSQLLFLEADPDISMATGSRAAWTDEGTLLSQVRNYMNGHGFEVMSSDGFMKAPMFSAVGFLFFKVFGIGQIQARLMVLAIVSICFLYLFTRKSMRGIVLLLMLLTFTLLPMHQHAHFALTEMVSVSCIFIAAYRFHVYLTSPQIWRLFWVHVWLVLAALFKVQFIYLIPLPLLCAVFLNNRVAIRDALFMQAFSIGLGLLVYYGFHDNWLVFQQAQSGSWSLDAESCLNIKNHVTNYILRKRMLPFTLLWLLSIAWFVLDQKRAGRPCYSLMVFALCWMTLELHKLPMDYLPIRYMVSFYAAMGLMIAVTMFHVFELRPKIWLPKAFAVLAILVFSTNIVVMADAFRHRKQEMGEVRAYLENTIRASDVVAGSWGPSLTWQIKNRVFPVWEGFTSSSVFSGDGAPTVLVAEPGFDDSGRFFQNELGLQALPPCDSIKTFNVMDWSVQVCWLSEKSSP
ncbi:MAG: hypothetical protein ACU4F9_03390 [Arcticibacter sp.]